MKIGIAAPVSLRLLSRYVKEGDELPEGYRFPPMAALVEEYLRRDHRVSLFTLDPTTRRPRVFEGGRLTIHVGRYRPRARHRARDFFAAERADLVMAMKSDPCDIIHAHWTYEFALAAMASGQPQIVTAHDAPLHVIRYLPDTLYRSLRFLMAMRVAHGAQHLTAVSPHVAEHYKRTLLYRRPIKVVPNGVSENLFLLGGEKSTAVGRDPTFATVLVGWNNLKNGRVALEAFKQVRQLVPGARLLMFGVGHGEGEEASLWAQNKGLTEGVEFVGARPHQVLLERLASEVDVLVHPSLEEAHPLGVVEAMALGIAVIGGDRSGGVPFTLEDGKAGLLVNVRSPASVAQAMLRFARDPRLCLAFGRAARESAHRRFHVGHVVSMYEDSYREVLSSA
jgi:glycosyltransferase involved in cell wall biosynthesis